jgi:hypothetical protein
MITHDMGNMFWGIDRAYGVPLYFRTTVHENEHPFRVSMAHGFHFLPGKALLVGTWKPSSLNPDKHLLQALGGRFFDPEATPQLA